jgi:hypothetical protein
LASMGMSRRNTSATDTEGCSCHTSIPRT